MGNSYYDNEKSYAEYIGRRRYAERNRGKKCPSSPRVDWRSLEDDAFPSSPHAIFSCLICDRKFPWAAGQNHAIPLVAAVVEEDDLREGEWKIPWWGWPIFIGIIPFAIPVALTVLAGEKICSWWRGDVRR